jgi:hypothetical protein
MRTIALVVLLCASPAFAQEEAELEVAGAEEEGAPDAAVEVAEPEPEEREGPSIIPDEREDLAAQIAERERLRPWHILLGSLAGLSTYSTTILGFLHFNDQYGWDGDPASAGCAPGNEPVLGRDLCTEPPWPHLVGASVLSVFYGAAFTIALFMPDPLNASEGRSEMATLLSAHKTLRWVLLGLLLGQLVLGAVAANVDADFDTRRVLASTHLALGVVTWGTMTTHGILGSMMAW